MTLVSAANGAIEVAAEEPDRHDLERRAAALQLAAGTFGADGPPGLYSNPKLAIAQHTARDLRRLDGAKVTPPAIAQAIAELDPDIGSGLAAEVLAELERAKAAAVLGDTTESLIPAIMALESERLAESRAAAEQQAKEQAAREETDPSGIRAMLRKNARTLTTEDLEREPPRQEFILYPYVPAGKVSILAGPGGTGKTTFLTYLAVCRALGRPMFGRPEMTPQQGETVIFSTEDGIDDYRRKLWALRQELGDEYDAAAIARSLHFFDLAGVPVRFVESEKGVFVPTPHAGHLAAVLREDYPRARWMALETVSRLAGGIETNESLSVLVVAAEQICREANIGCTYVAHVSQEAARGGIDDQHAPRGSTAFSDNARSTINLTRVDTERGRKKYLAGMAVEPDQLERLFALTCPIPRSAPAPEPLLLERAKERPVLRPVRLRPKETDPEALMASLLDLVTSINASGKTVTLRQIRFTHHKALGLSQAEAWNLAKDALQAGRLREGEKVQGGGSALEVAQ